MALKHYDMEAGTNGQAATTALTGALLLSNPSSLGTITFTTGAKNSGVLGLHCVAASTQDLTTRWGADASNNRMSVAFNFKYAALPASQGLLATLRHSTGIAWRLSLRQDGGLFTDGSSVSGDTAVGVTTVPNTWYRVEAVIDVSAGTGKVRVYKGNGLTLLATQLDQSGMNLGTNPVVAMDIFCNRNMTVDMDDIRLSDNITTFLGPTRPTKDPDSVVRPWDMVDNPGEYAAVGTTNFTTAVADESDTTYVESVSSPTGGSIMYALDPLTLGPVTVTIRHNSTVASPAVTRTVKLKQGSTTIATRTVTVPTTITNYSFTTTTAETNLLAWPRDNLYIEISDSAL